MTTITVSGIPRPQGSLRLVRGRLIADNPGLAAWRATVTQAAGIAWARRPALDEAVAIHAVLSLPRPKSAPKAWAVTPYWSLPWRHGTGDVDKLARALLDALTDAGVLLDDSRVVDLGVVKRWAGDPDGLPEPGARITITTVSPNVAGGLAA